MSKENKTSDKQQNENSFIQKDDNDSIVDFSHSAIVPNEQIVLYFQFDNDEPIECIKGNGKEFTLKMLPVENSFVQFTDGKKKFRMFIRHCQ